MEQTRLDSPKCPSAPGGVCKGTSETSGSSQIAQGKGSKGIHPPLPTAGQHLAQIWGWVRLSHVSPRVGTGAECPSDAFSSSRSCSHHQRNRNGHTILLRLKNPASSGGSKIPQELIASFWTGTHLCFWGQKLGNLIFQEALKCTSIHKSNPQCVTSLKHLLLRKS